MLYETWFLLALVTTWIIEIPILIALIRFVFRYNTTPIPKIIGTGALCTALTLPYLWFVRPSYVDTANYVLIGETLVFLVEAVILSRLLWLNMKAALSCSFVMNMASFLPGMVLL